MPIGYALYGGLFQVPYELQRKFDCCHSLVAWFFALLIGWCFALPLCLVAGAIVSALAIVKIIYMIALLSISLHHGDLK